MRGGRLPIPYGNWAVTSLVIERAPTPLDPNPPLQLVRTYLPACDACCPFCALFHPF
jgi:hypothetical protein